MSVIKKGKVTKEELRKAFADTLDKGTPRSAILVGYREEEYLRIELGFPYYLLEGNLVLGPYLKDIHTAPPEDYEKRKKHIAVSSLAWYKRIELSDIL